MLKWIKNGVENNILMPLYELMVCSQLEYCVQLWSPYHKNDTVATEGDQSWTVENVLDIW